MLWKLTWEGASKGRGPGQQAGGEGKADDKITAKTLIGPKLTAEEANRARDRAPTNKDGKLLLGLPFTHGMHAGFLANELMKDYEEPLKRSIHRSRCSCFVEEV